jgi:RHH-type proline utilization regulon transcriptional repressor/proline dehydrogenase/delta 1-pyrroline-5-carboxylate dehydrogenase
MVIDIFHEAGIPKDVLQLITARGTDVSQAFLQDARLRGIAFTGSGDTARQIQQDLAKRTGPMVTFIAETAGLNAMIVDSSALLETVVDDVITSAFRSAGQRCSALRILAVQEDIADDLTKMLIGAMKDLRIGDPIHLSTDIGPVINGAAKKKLDKHIHDMKQKGGKVLYACPLPEELPQDAYMAPHLIAIKRYEDVQAEAFGPILHVLRYKRKDLDSLIGSINASNYGLTLGIHTRINSFAQYIRERAHVGNVYVNRNMIGAVVGVQPFGGEGLSGTGPKAGGPNYLPRFATERVYTENLTAMGGNTQLLLMGEG